jgi:hypothetical protein
MRTPFVRLQHHARLVNPLSVQARRMSSKQQWLVIVSDHPGTIQKRIDVRPQHLSAVGENQAVKAGGTQPPNLRFLSWEES